MSGGEDDGLSVHATVAARGVRLDVDLPAGSVLGVLGPNGAGKSTLVELAAGLLRPDDGVVRVGGRTVAGPGAWVPPHARGAALLAQRPLLFPHLDALGNVAFGPRSQGLRRHRAAEVAQARLAEVGAAALAGRRPHQLSGGQAQRVALARALAPDPRVLLLDEPFSALDVQAADELRQVLRTVLHGRTAVLVTHDLLDVLALADAVVVLDGGRVVEAGATLEVLTRPRSAFAARLAGVNVVAGRLDGRTLRADGAPPLHGLVDPACVDGAPAAATFSPRAVAVHLTAPGGSPRNVVPVRTESLEHHGELVRVTGSTPWGQRLAADVTPAAVAELALAAGQDVRFSVKAAEVRIYPA